MKPVPARSPLAAVRVALALARPETLSAVSSPLKSESVTIALAACAVAFEPGEASALDVSAPVFTAEPSAG